jgi:hypothetical protein
VISGTVERLPHLLGRLGSASEAASTVLLARDGLFDVADHFIQPLFGHI